MKSCQFLQNTRANKPCQGKLVKETCSFARGFRAETTSDGLTVVMKKGNILLREPLGCNQNYFRNNWSLYMTSNMMHMRSLIKSPYVAP